MNKKFSTLVASLLFASAFSAYAGTAASMITAPNGVETRALLPNADALQLASDDGLDDAVTNSAAGVLKGFTNNARLQVLLETGALTSNNSGKTYFVSSAALAGAEADYGTPTTAAAMAPFYFTLNGDQLVGANGTVLSLDGVQHFDIVPLAKTDGTVTSFFGLKAISSVAAKNGKFIKIIANGTISADGDEDGSDAAIFASIETAYTTEATGTILNAELNGGFNMSVSFGSTTLNGAELFAGKLTAMHLNSGTFEAATVQEDVYLKNKDGKYLVFDETLNGTNAVKGGFKLVSEADAKLLTTTAQFTIKTADNGTETTVVEVDSKRLYVNVSNGTNVLTATTEALAPNKVNWAATSLGATNTVDFKTFLTGKYVKVSFVKMATGATASDVAYKANGILGLKYNATASPAAVESDYIKSSSVVAEDPATMWAPSIDGGDLVLTNRENKDVTVTLTALRDLKNGIYQIETVGGTADGLANGEQIKIEFVNSVTKTDGYMVEADNVLRNTTYYLGQSRRNADGDVPAYWAENHGTHQIGATVNKEEATQWNVA